MDVMEIAILLCIIGTSQCAFVVILVILLLCKSRYEIQNHTITLVGPREEQGHNETKRQETVCKQLGGNTYVCESQKK